MFFQKQLGYLHITSLKNHNVGGREQPEAAPAPGRQREEAEVWLPHGFKKKKKKTIMLTKTSKMGA